ncbi:MAG TPA: DUF488 domain-containing protein [Candidatus Binatia bacterium]|nr:DUF488 domain-containing protein [Candidatus Binatia bacterium]
MTADAVAPPPLVLTIGHSTRSFEELLALLQRNAVTRLADVRTIPKSRRHPHFAIDALQQTLPAAGVAYEHMAGLGGLRRPAPDSINMAWRNTSFRGYADYMQTPKFVESLEALIARAEHEQVAIMCAEAVHWRCHRSLISDALIVRGLRVEHILSETSRRVHELTPFARVEGTQVTYPGQPTLL